MAFILRAQTSGGITTGGVTSLPLPAGTQVGDVIVCILQDTPNQGHYKWNDSRLTTAINTTDAMVCYGVATSLADLQLSYVAPFWRTGYSIATFEPVQVTVSAGNSGGTGAVVPPSVPAATAVAAVGGFSSIVTPDASVPQPPWTGVTDQSTYCRTGIYTWYGDAPSPSGSSSGSNNDQWVIGVIGAGGTKAPPCRLYPRADSLGVGSGRLWPRANTQQAGRLNGPY